MPLIKGHLAKFVLIACYLPLILLKSPLILVRMFFLTRNQGKFEDFLKAFPGVVKAFLPLSVLNICENTWRWTIHSAQFYIGANRGSNLKFETHNYFFSFIFSSYFIGSEIEIKNVNMRFKFGVAPYFCPLFALYFSKIAP